MELHPTCGRATSSSSWRPRNSADSGLDADTGSTLVREARPGPVDHRLRPIFTCREEREVHRAPREKGGLACECPPARQLDDSRPSPDGRHRALVVVAERLGLLPGDPPCNVFARVVAGLEGDRAELGENLVCLRVG